MSLQHEPKASDVITLVKKNLANITIWQLFPNFKKLYFRLNFQLLFFLIFEKYRQLESVCQTIGKNSAGLRFYKIQLYTVIILHTQLYTAQFYIHTTLDGKTRHSTMRHATTRHITIRHDTFRYYTTRSGET